MRLRALVVLACALAVPVRAEDPPTEWADPSLEDALVAAQAVVRGHIQAPLETETEIRLAVEKIVAGAAGPEGVSVPLYGTRGGAPVDQLLGALRPGDEGIFLLRQTEGPNGKARVEIPTPTFGRFRVRSGRVAGSVRDSFVRIDMPVAEYETFLRNAWAKAKGGKADAAFITSCRTTLAALDATSSDANAPAHVALEGLALGAEPQDSKAALRFFASPSFQVRISAARVLERAGGEAAGEGLLRLAFGDQDQAVRSVAIDALARVKPVPKDAAAELVAHLKDLDAKEVPMHAGAEDPRANVWDGPMKAAFATLRELGAGDDATPAAIALLAQDEPDVLMTAILHLAKVKAKARVPEIVAKMRPADHPYGFSNEQIGNLLSELTGKNLGDDREAWRNYVKTELK